MNRLIISVGGVLLASSVAFGGTHQVNKSQNSEAEQQIRALLSEWDEAYKLRDTVALDRILADDFVLTDASGAVLNRVEYLMSVVKSPDFSRVESYASEDVTLTITGEKAKVNGRSKVKGRSRGRGQAVAGDYRFTDTWMKRDGRWQVVASQAVRGENQPVKRR